MAIDTRVKRSSAINVGSPWRSMLPEPDGAIGQGDRQATAYLYSGILATVQQGGAGGPTTRAKQPWQRRSRPALSVLEPAPPSKLAEPEPQKRRELARVRIAVRIMAQAAFTPGPPTEDELAEAREELRVLGLPEEWALEEALCWTS